MFNKATALKVLTNFQYDSNLGPMKRGFLFIFSVLFFFAIQMQSLTTYAHINCDHLQTLESEDTDHAGHDHDSSDHTSESCTHQHHCCHTSSAAYQAPKLQTQFLSLDLISLNFPSLNELAIEAPILEGPFQPPRV